MLYSVFVWNQLPRVGIITWSNDVIPVPAYSVSLYSTASPSGDLTVLLSKQSSANNLVQPWTFSWMSFINIRNRLGPQYCAHLVHRLVAEYRLPFRCLAIHYCSMESLGHEWTNLFLGLISDSIYEELISKISYIHSCMLLICSSCHSKKPIFNTKFPANGKC